MEYRDILGEVYREFKENLEEAKKIPIEDLIDAAEIYNEFSESSVICPSDGRSLEFSRTWNQDISTLYDPEQEIYYIITATSSETTISVDRLYKYLIENGLCGKAKIVHLTGNIDDTSDMNELLKQIGDNGGIYKRLVTPSASKINPGTRRYMPFGTEFEHKIPPIFQGIKNLAEYGYNPEIYYKTIDEFSSIIEQLENSDPRNIEMLIESILYFITEKKKIYLWSNPELDHIMKALINRLEQIPELKSNIFNGSINSNQDGSSIFSWLEDRDKEEINILFGHNHEKYDGRTHYINPNIFGSAKSDSELIPKDVGDNYTLNIICDAAIAIAFTLGGVINNLEHGQDYFLKKDLQNT